MKTPTTPLTVRPTTRPRTRPTTRTTAASRTSMRKTTIRTRARTTARPRASATAKARQQTPTTPAHRPTATTRPASRPRTITRSATPLPMNWPPPQPQYRPSTPRPTPYPSPTPTPEDFARLVRAIMEVLESVLNALRDQVIYNRPAVYPQNEVAWPTGNSGFAYAPFSVYGVQNGSGFASPSSPGLAPQSRPGLAVQRPGSQAQTARELPVGGLTIPAASYLQRIADLLYQWQVYGANIGTRQPANAVPNGREGVAEGKAGKVDSSQSRSRSQSLRNGRRQPIMSAALDGNLSGIFPLIEVEFDATSYLAAGEPRNPIVAILQGLMSRSP